MEKIVHEEKRAKTQIKVLEIVKEYLVRGAVEIRIKQFHDDTWNIIGYGYHT